MKYPVFDFDFVKIQEYVVDLNHADDKIRYLDYVIKEWDKVTNSLPIGVDIFPVLELEKDYWEYAFRVQKSGTTPDFKEGDGIYKDELVDDFLENFVFKLKFEKREVCNFEEDRIWQHYREQFTKRDGLMYLRWVLKEFLIAVELNQTDGLTIKAKEFKSRLKIKIRELERELGINEDKAFDQLKFKNEKSVKPVDNPNTEEKCDANDEDLRKYVFEKQIDSWKIIFDGQEIPLLIDYAANKYLKYLLEHPKKDIHICDLCDIVEKINYSESKSEAEIQRERMKNEKQWEEEGLTIIKGDEKIIVADEEGEKDLKSYLKSLSDDRKRAEEEGDEIEIEEINRKTEIIKKYSSGKKDSKGRITKLDAKTKRNLDKVSKNYKRLLAKLSENKKYENFYWHLKNHVDIGIHCKYTPDRDINWNQ